MTTPGVRKTKEITLTRITEALVVTTVPSPTTPMPKRKTMVTLSKPKSPLRAPNLKLPGGPNKILENGNLLQHRDQLQPKARERGDAPKTKGKTPPRPSETELTANFFPCEDCLALGSTNSDCTRCGTHSSSHYQKVVQSYKYVQTFRQSFLPSFPCPILLTSGHMPSVFGTGNCHGCSLYQQFLWRTHVSDSPPPSPYKHALYLGYAN